jgi:hypothetical protein
MFVGYSIVAMPGNAVEDVDMNEMAMAYNNTVRFYTDSLPINIDNCCMQTMTGYKKDFIASTLVPITGNM